MHVTINKAINKYFVNIMLSTLLFSSERHEGKGERESTALPFLTSALDGGEASS
jgi:hypothetical protein